MCGHTKLLLVLPYPSDKLGMSSIESFPSRIFQYFSSKLVYQCWASPVVLLQSYFPLVVFVFWLIKWFYCHKDFAYEPPSKPSFLIYLLRWIFLNYWWHTLIDSSFRVIRMIYLYFYSLGSNLVIVYRLLLKEGWNRIFATKSFK